MLDATFDEKGELKSMKQAGDFKYSEGPRKAQADNATLENEHNVMNLDAKARIADDSGSTAADHIVLDQATGDFDATGHVSTTRLPDEKKSSSDMLDKDEPTQGLADHVTSANRNHLIHYIGNAVLWQASNRIQADRIDVDREKKSLLADGQVVSQFQDKPNSRPDRKRSPTKRRRRRNRGSDHARCVHHRESAAHEATPIRIARPSTPAASTSGAPRLTVKMRHTEVLSQRQQLGRRFAHQPRFRGRGRRDRAGNRGAEARRHQRPCGILYG